MPDLTDREYLCGWDSNYWLLVVYVHGLLATDVGTFNETATLLESRGYVCQVGFPHDTLCSSINKNERDLNEYLEALDLPENGRVLFICHSRGGLVARSAIAKLIKSDKKWADRIAACITFGTPHLGVTLAEDPGKFIGLFAILQLVMKTNTFLPVFDILNYYTRYETFPGIQDMMPEYSSDDFLGKLKAMEKDLEGYNKIRQDKIFALGGIAEKSHLVSKLVRHVLDEEEHDLVVELESSLPSIYPKKNCQKIVNCNHFEYFQKGNLPGELIKRLVPNFMDPTERAARFKKMIESTEVLPQTDLPSPEPNEL